MIIQYAFKQIFKPIFTSIVFICGFTTWRTTPGWIYEFRCSLNRSWDFGPLLDQGPIGQNSWNSNMDDCLIKHFRKCQNCSSIADP